MQIGLGDHERRVRALSPARRMAHVLTERGAPVRARYGLSLGRQAAEVLYYHWRLGMGRAEYYMFEFYRPDMGGRERLTYLSQASWAALSRAINHPTRAADDSKLLLSERLGAAGVPVPRTFACTAARPAAHEIDMPGFVPIDRLAETIPAAGCVVKRDYSTWGLAVFVFDGFDGTILRHVSGRGIGLSELHAAIRDRGGLFLVQERLDNHPGLAAIGLPSLATVRLLTYGGDERVRIARATVKLPVGRTGVDNYHAGGIAAPVDLESGEIGAGADNRQLERMAAHSESGRRFAGVRVPLWQDVLAVTRRAAAALPEFPCVGWDVAVTPDGPVAIEANSVWGTGIVQRPQREGLWQGEFREWCLQRTDPTALDHRLRRWLNFHG